MKNLFQSVFIYVISISAIFIFSCRKENLTKYDTAIDNIKTFTDDSISLPVAITAGDNCLLYAYNNSAGQIIFNLTDKDGKLIWQKQFGLKSISKILKENDGTFTILTTDKLVNINKEGTILRDEPFFTNLTLGNILIFHAFLNKNNNYVICGMSGVGSFGRNNAFAAEYTHDGTLVFKNNYIDTTTPPRAIYLGNYDAITGGDETDDGGYIFFAHVYYGYLSAGRTDGLEFTIIKTDNRGTIIWQKNNLVLDSADIHKALYIPPFVDQFPYNVNIYGFLPDSYSHELLKTADGNYLCFLNLPDYTASDQRARVYKIDPNGNTIDSTFISFGKYNRFMGTMSSYYKATPTDVSYSCGSGVVRNADNTFSICMQNGFFGSKGLTTSYIGENRSFIVRIDENLNILNTHYIQNYYSDCFNSVCKSSDGRTVYFGLISSFGSYYKPALIFSDDN
jgi:hypothetical protein